jgi:hypothetical protein
MSEAWFLELLGSVRDVARSHAMIRLAEHLDDAMLVAASEFHESMLVLENQAGHDREDRKAAGDVSLRGFH